MGGFGTWSLGLSHPEKFAAIAPICGGGDFITPYLADKSVLTNLAVWAFHGAKDPVVPLEESQRMVNLLEKIGVMEVKFTVYPEAQHDCWTQTYANPELFAWFLQHSR
jgi:predicted peptidase